MDASITEQLDRFIIFVEPGPQDWIIEPLELVLLDVVVELQAASTERIAELEELTDRYEKEIAGLRRILCVGRVEPDSRAIVIVEAKA